MRTLNVQEFGKKEKYIVGKYDLEVLTLPRITLKDVEIKQSSVNTIKIPASGSTNFIKQGGAGHGSIYTDDGKTVTWVCNLKRCFTKRNYIFTAGEIQGGISV